MLDDIRWLQGQMERWKFEVFERLCPPGGLLWIYGGGYPITTAGIFGGVVYISGQGMFNVPNNTLVGWNGSNTFVRIGSPVFNSGGLKTFQNGAIHDTYELPQATIQTGTPGVGDIPLNNWAYLNQLFDEEIVTFASGITNGGTFKVIANANKLVISCTQINGPAGTRTVDEDLFTLDTAIFDPEGTIISLAVEGGGAYNVPVTIDTTGKVTARFSTVNGEYPLGFEINTVIA